MAGKRHFIAGFSGRIKSVWKDSGETQEEFAHKVGVSRNTVRSWLYGKSYPNTAALIRICLAYKVSADYLLFGGR